MSAFSPLAVYQFKAPAQLRVRHPDGSEVLMGYGIGDAVAVVDPESPSITLLPRLDPMPEEVLLASGSTIKGLFGAHVARAPHIDPASMRGRDLFQSLDASVPRPPSSRARSRM